MTENTEAFSEKDVIRAARNLSGFFSDLRHLELFLKEVKEPAIILHNLKTTAESFANERNAASDEMAKMRKSVELECEEKVREANELLQEAKKAIEFSDNKQKEVERKCDEKIASAQKKLISIQDEQHNTNLILEDTKRKLADIRSQIP